MLFAITVPSITRDARRIYSNFPVLEFLATKHFRNYGFGRIYSLRCIVVLRLRKPNFGLYPTVFRSSKSNYYGISDGSYTIF